MILIVDATAFFTAWGRLAQPAPSSLSVGITVRVSLPEEGSDADAESRFPSVSADGRYVAFQSYAQNMIRGDDNGTWDIFVRDRQAGRTVLVSVPIGTEVVGNSWSEHPSISANGRCVAFESHADNLVYNDTNTVTDVFVRDLQTGQTTRVSVNSSGQEANDASAQATISGDGRYVAFLSWASNLVISDTNDNSDIFVHDRQTGQTTRVSVSSTGQEGDGRSYEPAISSDGRTVAFVSHATNLVAGDTNGYDDVFVHDRDTGQTTRVSIGPGGAQADNHCGEFGAPAISGDGRYVAFASRATTLVISDTNGAVADVFLHDRQTGQTMVVSVNSAGQQGNSDSGWPSISADGRYVAFASLATNLVSGDTNNTWDVFLHDRETGETRRVSVTSGGGQGDGPSEYPAISTSGRFIAFESDAARLVSGDTNGTRDVFLRDEGSGGSQVDLLIESVTPVQALAGQPLVQGKATAVRVVVGKTGDAAVENVSLRLTCNGQNWPVFYVADPANLDPAFTLVHTNAGYPLNFAASETSKTVYFFGDGLTPQAGPYVITATVDYTGAIVEFDETNNDAGGTFDVVGTGWPPGSSWLNIVYVKADWGATPESAFTTYFGNSSAFVRGTFPVAGNGFYAERFSAFTADSTSFRGADGQLSGDEMEAWVLDLNQRLLLSRPYADAFVAVLPQNWFSSSTSWCNGCDGIFFHSTRVGFAELNADLPMGYKTSAHELGHVFGLCLDCEQYNPFCNPDIKDGIGNAVYNGLWVERRRLMDYDGHPVYSFMGASAYADFWVDAGIYSKLLNDHRLMGSGLTALGGAAEKAILVAGTLFEDGHIELADWYVLDGAQVDELPPGDYWLRYLDASEQVLAERTFDLSLTTEGITVTQAPFVFRAPYITDTAHIVIGMGASELASRTVSAHTPVVTVTAPTGGELRGIVGVSWSATDEDGDDLAFTVLYTPDGGATWNALATGLSGTTYAWDTAGLAAGNRYQVRVLATDGVNTGEDVSDGFLTVIGYTYLPVVFKSD